MLAWITLPSPTEISSSVQSYAGEVFSGLLPVALAVAGLIIGALLLRFIGKGVVNAVQRITGRGRGGRRVLRRI